MPYVFPDGTVAVELGGAIPLPILSPDGDPYLLAWHLDGMWTDGDNIGPRERKTTKSTLGTSYFDKYAPDVQIDTYDMVTNVLYGDRIRISAVMMEAAQVAVGFTRFGRHHVSVPEERRAETFDEIQYWIKRAEDDARRGYFPKNTSSCSANGGCQFRGICRLAPSNRAAFLKSNFVVQKWNPLEER